MRAPLVNLPTVARALGLVLATITIVAAAPHFRTPSERIEPRSAETSATPGPLAEELKRRQFIADQAKDDSACEAAWAENRRRFFTYAPACAPTPADPAKSAGR
jgi:conjugative transfer region protein TrbK